MYEGVRRAFGKGKTEKVVDRGDAERRVVEIVQTMRVLERGCNACGGVLGAMELLARTVEDRVWDCGGATDWIV